MIKTLCLVLLALTALQLPAQDNRKALMPMPNSIAPLKGVCRVKPQPKLYMNDSSLIFSAKRLTAAWQESFHVALQPAKSQRADVRLLVDKELQGDEHYTLQVTADGVEIRGGSDAAVWLGVMTLEQLLLGDVCHTAIGEIARVRIDDRPRFGYRALMIDPARNFIPVKDVKFFIDQIARYKFNTLQIHLTDNEGWRVEIKKYPQLTRNGSFYTQAELKEIVAYAAERYIEVVPELDVPGHTVALLSSFPELACTVWRDSAFIPGVHKQRTLCMANPRVYELYADILEEVARLFPSQYIHLGGDEAAIAENWGKCDHCKALMQQKGYTEVAQLMNDFFRPILNSVRSLGKKPILWCELDNVYPPFRSYLFDYPRDVTLVTWRYANTPTCMEYSYQSGNDLIMAPGEYAYLDYPQLQGDLPEFNNWGMPVLTLTQCYEFDPGYGLPAERQRHIKGVMGTLWAEAMKDVNRITYMAFPRSFALAEAGWTQMENRDWESFKERMYANLTLLMRKGVSVRVPFEIEERVANP